MKNKKLDLPAMPFYVGDWLKAPEIRILPLESRAVWFEMLCIMWQCEPRGYLAINNIAITPQELAFMIGGGTSPEEMHIYLKILEEKKIFSRNKNGIIFSRFMVKLDDISSKRKASGKLGGKQKGSKKEANTLANTEDEYESENEIKNVDEIEDINLEFGELWKRYPRKDGKKRSFISFKRSVKTKENLQDIWKALENYIKLVQGKDPKYIKNGSTWFNQWQDFIDYEDPSNPMSKSYLKSIDELDLKP